MLVGFLLGAALNSLAQGVAETPKVDEALARINGRVVTRSELYDQKANLLLQQRYDFYHNEREALAQMIDDQLLQTEATHQGITVQQFIEREVSAKVKDPTDAELHVFYEGVNTDQTFDQVKGQLLARVHAAREKAARESFVNALRAQAKIQVLLSPPQVAVSTDDAPARGPKNAAVTVVEFADFECPFCRQMQPELDRLEKEYDGKVIFFYKEFPLNIHPHAEKAAEAARCAGEQGAFWQYHDTLFRDGSGLEISQLKQSARSLKLDGARFDSCLDSGQQAPAIEKDVAQGFRLGLAGTPGLFVNGRFLSGVVPYETLREVVDQQLTASK
jgi:protein-disulfide isomerase